MSKQGVFHKKRFFCYRVNITGTYIEITFHESKRVVENRMHTEEFKITPATIHVIFAGNFQPTIGSQIVYIMKFYVFIETVANARNTFLFFGFLGKR